MALLIAVPYDRSCASFEFDSAEGYAKKEAGSRCEEWEIELLDGSDGEVAMFRAAEPTQGELDLWFGTLEAFDEGEAAAFTALVDRGQSAQEAADSVMDSGGLAEMTLEEYAYELVDDIGVEGLTGDYFDYEGFGRDVRIEGGDQMHLQEVIDAAEGSDDEDEIEEAKGAQEEIDRLDALTPQELGYEIVDMYGGLEEIGDQNLASYFDYAKLARDLSFDDYAEVNLGGTTYLYDGSRYF